MTSLIRLFLLLLGLCALPARGALDPALAAGLAGEDADARIAAIAAIAASGEALALPLLTALAEDRLQVSGQKLLIIDAELARDAFSGDTLPVLPDDAVGIMVNNRIRTALNGALAQLRLNSPDRQVRLAAARELQSGAELAQAPAIAQALDREADADIRELLASAHAQAMLKSGDAAQRLAAVKALGESSSPAIKSLLLALLERQGDAYAEPDEAVRTQAQGSLRQIEARLRNADLLARIFTGLSLGSILLLAALGLAITYGVMGVINMAHGELLMVGAYATFVVQGLFRSHLSDYLDWYVVAAVPVAFIAAALVGMLLERVVIRNLYGRPLETLLATWGLSLILIQAARVLFGAQNVELANPSWMSGGVEVLAGVVLPWNRIVLIGFSMAVMALVWALLNLTRLGLFVRAVTQNRAMAGCVGVPTGRIDTLAFGLGAGIAGLGGVALSQVANVGPDMGQGYIIDSFLVVVVGGVGQLAGAVWAALGLGILSKFLEGWTGAVIAKILLLVFIIVFIQKRPQGLFALKGRFVD